MIVDKISYQKVFPIAPYINEKIGVEIQLDEHDIPGEALTHAKELVEQWHKEANPGLYLYQTVPFEPPVTAPTQVIPAEKPIPEDQRIESLIADIYSCGQLKVLESYRLLAKTHPSLQQAYDEMLKKLS